MKLSLGKKLTLGGGLMVALPIIILGWYAYQTASRAWLTRAAERPPTLPCALPIWLTP